MELEKAIAAITPLNTEFCIKAQQKWDNIAKPLRSLGRLEEMVIRLAGIQETEFPKADKKAVLIFCSDNGVVEEAVTQTSSDITAIVAENFTKGIASINSFSRVCEADVLPVDIGICKDMKLDGIINRKISYGTQNILKGSAMTREQCIKAIEVGIDLVTDLKNKGYNLIATGEMGIGNTTTSSAVISVLENLPVETVTGKGAGLTSEGLLHKIEVIKKAIALNKPDRADIIDVMSKLGGYDICGMVGTFIGGALNRVPIIIDGFISAVSANCAIRLAKGCKDFMFASHCSAEPAGYIALKAIDMEAYINCGMCLGEGTGALISAKLFDFALSAYNEIVEFSNVSFEKYELLK